MRSSSVLPMGSSAWGLARARTVTQATEDLRTRPHSRTCPTSPSDGAGAFISPTVGTSALVNTAGIITTIAGDGHSGTVANGTAALSAPLNSLSSIAFSPSGELYLADSLSASPFGSERQVGHGAWGRPVRAASWKVHSRRRRKHCSGRSWGHRRWLGLYRLVDIQGHSRWSGESPDMPGEAGGTWWCFSPVPAASWRQRAPQASSALQENRLVTSYLFRTMFPARAGSHSRTSPSLPTARYMQTMSAPGGFQLYQQLTSVAHNHVAVLWPHRIAN